MLRTTHLLKTSIARYKLNSSVSVERGYQNYRAILSASTSINDSSSGIHYKSLLQWPGIFRIDINNIILEISQDVDYAAEAKSRYDSFSIDDVIYDGN
jgi:hypothetical protein